MHEGDRLASVLGAWREAAEQGRYIEPAELISSHPDLEAPLREHFVAQGILDDFFADVDARPSAPPDVLGDYRLGRELGRGGMGVVFEAEQISMGRRVALKVVFPTIATTVATRKRFEREARITGRLHHTNIVTVYAMGQQEGYLYFAMELVDGAPLDEIIQHLARTEDGEAGDQRMEAAVAPLRGPLAHRRLAMMFAGAADALQVAHAHGVVHRDIKPSNLILDPDGLLKLTDFGLARLVGDQLGVTRTGDVIGTPLYMSPEQIRAAGDGVDHRTDIYSLGATLFEALTHERPFQGTDIASVCASILSEEPRPIRELVPGISKDLVTIVEKAMAKERADRYASAGELAADLRAFAERRPIRARPLGILEKSWRKVKRHRVRSALVGVALLSALIAGWAWHRSGAEEEQRRELEYQALLTKATNAVPFVSEHESVSPANRLYQQAIDLMPDRPEAYFARALENGNGDARLRDIDAAEARGLSPRSIHLARAFIYRNQNRAPEAQEEERLARAGGEPTPTDRYLEGLIALETGDRPRAKAIFEALIGERSLSRRLHQKSLVQLAIIHHRGGTFARSIELLQAAYDSTYMPPSVHLHLAALWHALDKRELAESRLQGLLGQMGAMDPPGDWAIVCETAERFAPAEWIRRVAEAGLAHHPNAPGLSFFQAIGFWKEGRFEEARRVCEETLKRNPEYGALHAIHAKSLYSLQELEAAVEAFRKCIAWSPHTVPPRFDMAVALQRLGRVDEALEAVEAGLALGPGYSFGHEMKGRLLRERGDNEAALQSFRKAIEILPSAVQARRSLVDALQVLGHHEEALAVLAAGLRLNPDESTLLYDRIHLLMEMGREEIWKREIQSYLERAEGHIRRAPDVAKYHFNKAVALQYLGRNEDALVSFDEAVQLDETFKEAWHDRALALYHLGRLEQALTSVQKAVDLDPGYSSAHATLGNVLLNLGRPGDAIAPLREAVRLEPGGYLAGINLYNLGRVYQNLKQFDKAVEAYREATQVTPRDVDCWVGLSMALVSAGKREEAGRALQKAIALHPGNVQVTGMQAALLAEQGKIDEAVAAYDEALKTQPDHPSLLFNKAVTLNRARRYQAAEDVYRIFVGVVPDVADGWRGLGNAHLWQSEYEDARGAFDKALQLAPKDPFARMSLGICESNLGRFEAAIEAYEAALALAPHHPNVLACLSGILCNCEQEDLRDPARGLQLARKAVEAAPQAPVFAFMLGWALIRTNGSPERIVAAFERSLEEPNPDRRGATNYVGLAIGRARVGDLEGAREALAKADEKDKEDPAKARRNAHLRADAVREIEQAEKQEK